MHVCICACIYDKHTYTYPIHTEREINKERERKREIRVNLLLESAHMIMEAKNFHYAVCKVQTQENCWCNQVGEVLG